MIRYIYQLVFLHILLVKALLYCEVFVLYTPHSFGRYGKEFWLRSRLGNQALTLMRAYSIAKANNYTLVYEPIELNLFEEMKKRIKIVSCEEFLKYKKFKMYSKSETICPSYDYLYKITGLALCEKIKPYATKDVVSDFREMIFSKVDKKPNLKKDESTIQIGVHIRTGIGFDSPLKSVQYYSTKDVACNKVSRASGNNIMFLDVCKPTKAPPMQFYINAMEYLVKHPELESKNIVFYIFTDHPCVENLIRKLKEHTSFPLNLMEGKAFSQSDNKELEDLVFMSSLDGIIRPKDSTFSALVSLITDFDFEIYPSEVRWYGDYLVVDEIFIKTPKKESISKI